MELKHNALLLYHLQYVLLLALLALHNDYFSPGFVMLT